MPSSTLAECSPSTRRAIWPPIRSNSADTLFNACADCLHPSTRPELVADLRELGLVDDQLAGQVHQVVQPVDVHAAPSRSAAGRHRSLAVRPPRRALRLVAAAGRAAGAAAGCVDGRAPRFRLAASSRSAVLAAACRSRGSTLASKTPAMRSRSLTASKGWSVASRKRKQSSCSMLVELLRRWLALGQLAQLGEFFIDHLGFQPGGGQGGLEFHFADISRPAADRCGRNSPIAPPAARAPTGRNGLMRAVPCFSSPTCRCRASVHFSRTSVMPADSEPLRLAAAPPASPPSGGPVWRSGSGRWRRPSP